MIRFLSKKSAFLAAVTFFGLLLLLPTWSGKPLSSFPPSAEAGFFSNDLELFKEVVDLVGDKYIYPPIIKKCL